MMGDYGGDDGMELRETLCWYFYGELPNGNSAVGCAPSK